MHIVTPHLQKRFVLSALIVIALAVLFWSGSRYPALNEKAMMSGAIQLEDALSFEARFVITTDMGQLERVFWSTLNWINTNKKGMIFGILFAAAFLTAMTNLRTKSFRGGFSNSLLGLVIGTPLGVCVNCAAPIARGMYSSGLRAETTLSAMIASPTLNIVVLTMLFSLMPIYMALTKIAFSLIVILVLIPWLCRFLPRTEIAPELLIYPTPWGEDELNPTAGESLPRALIAVAKSFAANLWYILKMTLPLMALAGLLGTLVAIYLPADLVMTVQFSLLILLAVVLVGVFLPVPIGFDVVMAGAMLGAGLAPGYVMALLFTLGSFSIYSFMIVAQSVGWRAGWLLAGAVALCGVIAGYGAHSYHNWQTDRALQILLQSSAPSSAGWGAAMAATADPWTITGDDAQNITVSAQVFNPVSPADTTLFSRFEAWEVGIDKPVEFSFRDMWPPFWEGRSLSSADIDQDGDLDLVIASTEVGLYLYLNGGNGQFSRRDLDLGSLAQASVFNAVLSDIDNDGWPDLFIATYDQGNFLWRNVAGDFGSEPPKPVANTPEAKLALALSFADADRDGDLDVAVGNWTAGWYRRIPGEESRNRILWNQDGQLNGDNFTDLPGIPGETLSILFSDINADGNADLLVGNDFDVPDYFYYGDGRGGFDMITFDQGLIPHTTTTTMAIKTGDLTGDGQQDIYLAQIAGRSSGVSKTLKMQSLDLYCDRIKRPEDRAICERNMAIKQWYKSGNNFDPTYASKCQELEGRYRIECKAMLVKDLAIQKHDENICGLIPSSQPIPRAYCDNHFKPIRQPTAAEAKASLQQIQRSNVLLHWNGQAYDDIAEAQGLEIGGWSWDTKLADFDNDGDLDVYVVNGTWVPNEISPSNLYFENDGTGKFTEKSGPSGLEDYLMTAVALSFDFDRDGDLDVLTHPVNGPLVLFRNNSQRASIAFALEDHIGNRNGIGATLLLRDSLGRVQQREVQLGGGFMSFDPAQIYFGLSDDAVPVELRIRWATGGESVVTQGLDAGATYLITRQKP